MTPQDKLRQAKQFEKLDGFVTFHRTYRHPFEHVVARGLFMPILDSSGVVKSRSFLLENKKSPSWFKHVAEEYVDTDQRIRVRVCNTYDTVLAFVRPILGSQTQARAEGMYCPTLQATPHTLDKCSPGEKEDLLVLARHHYASLVPAPPEFQTKFPFARFMVTQRGMLLMLPHMDAVRSIIKNKLIDPEVDLIVNPHQAAIMDLSVKDLFNTK